MRASFMLSSVERWREHAPEPPWLPDIAAFEIAYAAVQGEREMRAEGANSGAIRRHASVALLRSAHDITPMLEALAVASRWLPGAARRDTYLALAMPGGGAVPAVYTLSRELCQRRFEFQLRPTV
jgi:hypothetical protein